MSEYDDLINKLLEQAPDTWDDDAAAEAIAVDYVRELERRVLALGGSLERWQWLTPATLMPTELRRPGMTPDVQRESGRAPDYRWSEIDSRCHVPVTCTSKECTGCMFCTGGLYACQVCGGLEGSVTTQCAGRRLTADELDAVYALRLDFNHNRWWINAPADLESEDA